MLSSRQRMGNAPSKYLSKLFTGPVERFEVAASHAEAMDPRTPAFAAHLAHCLERIFGEAANRAADRPAFSTVQDAETARPH
jgi:hypothetical protein